MAKINNLAIPGGGGGGGGGSGTPVPTSGSAYELILCMLVDIGLKFYAVPSLPT